jgi:hypothetical protein
MSVFRPLTWPLHRQSISAHPCHRTLMGCRVHSGNRQNSLALFVIHLDQGCAPSSRRNIFGETIECPFPSASWMPVAALQPVRSFRQARPSQSICVLCYVFWLPVRTQYLFEIGNSQQGWSPAGDAAQSQPLATAERSEARELLASIYGWFTEGLDTPVLKDAKALLDELA